jgi:transposase-like protein
MKGPNVAKELVSPDNQTLALIDHQSQMFTNHCYGTGAKTVLTEGGTIRVDVPRDHDGSFELLVIHKHEQRFTGFDDKMVAMYDAKRVALETPGV